MARRKGNALSIVAALALVVAWVGAQAESHVRIIRLSYVDGQVQMDRATGQGLERAILNTPITEGARLVTGNDGLAEVEFENNSTVRLGENSEVQFTKLVVNDEEAKVNDIQLVKGTAYFDTKSGKDEIYRATIGDSTFLIHRDTQLRMSDDTGKPTVAVMKGEVELQDQQGVKITKKETLTLDPGNSAGYEIAKGVDAAPLDRWNAEREAYQTSYSYNNVGGGPRMAGYGYSDLSYYGGWSYLPGMGYGWQPYGAASWLGWNPWVCGAWVFSPFWGYGWASSYPWGWLPYHYGSWSYLNGSGWFWMPGSPTTYHNGWSSAGFQNAPIVTRGPTGFQAPAPPSRPISPASAMTVRVGTLSNVPAYLPGGRVPPDFRSVVPGSKASSVSAFAAPRHNAPVFVPATAAGAQNHGGHVFVAPPHQSASYGAAAGGYSAAMGGAAAMSHGTSTAGGSHAMSAGGSHGSGGGHGSPR
jgi:hypothetical protein